MKFVCSSDWHLATKGPVTRKDDWPEAIFAKLDQLAKLAIAIKARGILCGGDIFTKDSRVDWQLMNRLILWCRVLQRNDITLYTIPGNHDLKNDRYFSLKEQPLGILFAAGVAVDLSFNVVTLYEAHDLSTRISLSGIPYPAATMWPTAYNDLSEPLPGRSILLAHCFATPTGGSYFGEPILSYRDLFKLPYDAFVFGHDHSDNGVLTLSDNAGVRKVFVNNGALSRGSIAQENIDRVVKCTILDVTKERVTAQEVRLNVAPASEVFDLALKVQKDREEHRVDQFIDSLEQDLVGTDGLDFRERVSKMDLTDEVRTRVKSYIEKSEKVEA